AELLARERSCRDRERIDGPALGCKRSDERLYALRSVPAELLRNSVWSRDQRPLADQKLASYLPSVLERQHERKNACFGMKAYADNSRDISLIKEDIERATADRERLYTGKGSETFRYDQSRLALLYRRGVDQDSRIMLSPGLRRDFLRG